VNFKRLTVIMDLKLYYMESLVRNSSKHLFVLLGITSVIIFGCSLNRQKNSSEIKEKPRVIVSSDIGGTDPDDFQSMIHFLMYADRFKVEGIIASPYGQGRKKDILYIIDLYEKDFPRLKQHRDFPSPEYLRSVTKQGAADACLARGWGEPTEGSEWIIGQAKTRSNYPLWILVWGGLDDLAQALHDAPEIVPAIRVYWIGGPNKKWSVNSYCYIASNFPDLFMIENNSTYRGWIIDDDAKPEFKGVSFYEKKIIGRGAMGTDFGNYYGGSIKMGDTPSVAYLLNGDPGQPESESWGGSFTRLSYSAFREFKRNTTLTDTIPPYSVITWSFLSEEVLNNSKNPEIFIEIDGQQINGFYAGKGVYKVRFVPKRTGNWKYVINCTSKKLHGQAGEFVSANPWPGRENPENIKMNNWWSDRTDKDLYLGQYQGARTVSKWREEFLNDWAKRFEWISE